MVGIVSPIELVCMSFCIIEDQLRHVN